MRRVRFLLVGGFLGAGKTTAIARLARHYVDQGKKVGLVTNDQAYGLVDTQSLRAQGFDVGEVTGACFCCKFNDLVATAGQLAEHQQPDVIIAEPVGSCTDLVATVIEPLSKLYGDRYEIGPLAVLLKPDHGRKILADEQGLGFSPKAAYIFLKQLEEADVVVLNKIDRLTAGEQEQLVALVRERFPDKEVLATSARQGNGFGALIAELERARPECLRTPEVDYDIYAAGEAELGWLNCSVKLRSEHGSVEFPLDQIVVELVELLAAALAAKGAEPAHLKILGEVDGAFAIANQVSSQSPIELSVAADILVPAAVLTVNARVALDPEQLASEVAAAVELLAQHHGLRSQIEHSQHFRPGRPVPTHRMPLGHS
jgi:Ni2+-binding GTPase involved in maturation of urease and hydrogenase